MSISNFFKYQKPHHVIYVSRISDRKVFDIGNFMKYIKTLTSY